MDEKIFTFGDIYNYPKLNKHEGLQGRIPVRYGDIYLGIEIEIEKATMKTQHPSSSWTITDDGSLKDGGLEIVTKPIMFKYMENELRRALGNVEGEFSQRTSIHVHMNARDFTYEELARFILIYACYERALYRFGGDRWKNEYCIPITETLPQTVTALTQLKNASGLNGWCKYYGFNLRPLFCDEKQHGDYKPKIGTVEFRQFAGTDNIEHIMDWCNLITCMKFAAKKITTPALCDFIIGNVMCDQDTTTMIFKEWAGLLTNQQLFRNDVGRCTMKAKYLIASTKIHEEPFTAKNTVKNKFYESTGYHVDTAAQMANAGPLLYNFPPHVKAWLLKHSGVDHNVSLHEHKKAYALEKNQLLPSNGIIHDTAVADLAQWTTTSWADTAVAGTWTAPNEIATIKLNNGD